MLAFRCTAFWRGWPVLVLTCAVWVTTAFGGSMGWAFFLPHLKGAVAMEDTFMGISWGIALCTAAIVVPYAGRAVDACGPWRVVAMCLPLVLATTACIRFINVSWQIPIFQFLNRTMLMGATACACQKVINAWFVRRRSLASLALSYSDVALFLIPIAVDALMETLGWQNACVAIAVFIILPPQLFFLIVVRDSPENFNTVADGAALPVSEVAGASTTSEFGSSDAVFTLAEARRTVLFWVLTLSFTAFELLMPGFCYHSVAFMASVGFTNDAVRITFLMMNICGMLGSLAAKLLIDSGRVGTGAKGLARVLSLSLAIGACAPAVYCLVMDGSALWQPALYGALIGLITGGQQVVMNIVWATTFGFAHCAHINGLNLRFNFLGAGLGPLLIGLNLDYAANAYIAQWFMMGLLVLCSVCLWITPAPSKPMSCGTEAIARSEIASIKETSLGTHATVISI